MSKKKQILLMFAKGASQAEVAAALRASKRDVSACAKALRERGLTFDAVAAMRAAEVDAMLAPPAKGPSESAYLAPDMAPLVERKRRNRKITVKMFWMEHCEEAASAGMRTRSVLTTPNVRSATCSGGLPPRTCSCSRRRRGHTFHRKGGTYRNSSLIRRSWGSPER